MVPETVNELSIAGASFLQEAKKSQNKKQE
jgi:hypothetical protein